MKNVYSKTVNQGGAIIQGTIPDATKRSLSGFIQLRGVLTVILFSLFTINTNGVQAQNCPTSGTTVVSTSQNTYYIGKQAAVSAGATSILLGAIGSGANFGSTPIAVGDIILIIQMQGAQLLIPTPVTNSIYGSNTSGLGAGMITTGLTAGTMEFAVATNAVPVAGGTLNIAAGLVNAYSNVPYGTNGQYTYQVIRVPQFFNIQLGATIMAPKWNGSTGGVIVLSAVNQFNFNGMTVSADSAGFRGGGGRALAGQTGLNKNDFYGPSTNGAHGSKGEGIAGTPRYLYTNALPGRIDLGVANEGYPGGSYARGAPGNAGGGGSDGHPDGNDQNSGGGGGGNGGAGGTGGNGWSSFTYTGGRGGTAFQTYGPTVTYYSPNRLIMGGGGGSGSTNNASGSFPGDASLPPNGGAASGGSQGGGMVIINSTTITGTGTVTASGAVPNNTVTVDGSGGGGAGGSILIYANSGQAGVTAIANGGNGSDNHPKNLDATQHGPGGGGGGGVIYSNGALNVASSVAGGLAGISVGTTATDNFGAFPGSPGVITQTFPFSQLPPKMQTCQAIVLPVTLLNFSASYESANNVKVSWTTTDEINADYFVVERSTDATSFAGIAQVNASETSNPVHSYNVNDQLDNVNSNIIYYRLRIVDKNGKYTYSKVVPVKLDQPQNVFSIYPNPVDNYAVMNIHSEKSGTGMMRLMDNAGKPLITKSFPVNNGNNSVLIDQLGFLPRGIYIVQVMVNNNLYNQKIVKK